MSVEKHTGNGTFAGWYFVHQFFTSPWSSSGLPSPLWIQKQLNYQQLCVLIHHVCRSMWPAREAKPCFATTLKRSAHDCETSLLLICVSEWYIVDNFYKWNATVFFASLNNVQCTNAKTIEKFGMLKGMREVLDHDRELKVSSFVTAA